MSLLLLCACGGGSSDILPPGHFTVTSQPLVQFYDLAFGWTPASGSVDGYNLQGSENAGPFQTLNTGLIPADTVGGTLTLAPSTPELAEFLFQIDSVKGSQASAWAQAAFQLGIRPATSFSGSIQAGVSAIHLTWKGNSAVADSLTLQRTATPYLGGSPIVTILPAPALGATAYDDNDLPENYNYDYQLTYNKGDLASASADSGNIYYGLNAPENLAISMGTSTATLTWTLTSSQSTAVNIHRTTVFGATVSPSGILATLPAGARTFTDTGLSTGIYSYWVGSYEASTDSERPSAAMIVCTQPAPIDGLTVQAQFEAIPQSPWAQLDQQGEWLLWPVGLAPQSYGLEIWTPTTSTQQAYPAADGSPSDPPILMDSGFQPHMAMADGSGNLVHLWRTADGWQTELVATGAETFFGSEGCFPFLQAPDGTLHLFYGFGSPYQQGVEAIRGPGGWTFLQDPQLAAMAAFAFDPDGNLYGLQYQMPAGSQATPLLLWSRAADGTWSSQTVPGGGTLSGALFQADATGTFHFLFVKPADASGPQGTVHYGLQSGVWSPPEYLTSGSPQGPSDIGVMPLSVSPQDQRLFCCSNSAEGIVLYTRDPDGTWSSGILLPAGIYPSQCIQGLTASGKVYVVARPADIHDYGAAIFTEQ